MQRLSAASLRSLRRKSQQPACRIIVTSRREESCSPPALKLVLQFLSLLVFLRDRTLVLKAPCCLCIFLRWRAINSCCIKGAGPKPCSTKPNSLAAQRCASLPHDWSAQHRKVLIRLLGAGLLSFGRALQRHSVSQQSSAIVPQLPRSLYTGS